MTTSNQNDPRKPHSRRFLDEMETEMKTYAFFGNWNGYLVKTGIENPLVWPGVIIHSQLDKLGESMKEAGVPSFTKETFNEWYRYIIKCIYEERNYSPSQEIFYKDAQQIMVKIGVKHGNREPGAIIASYMDYMIESRDILGVEPIEDYRTWHQNTVQAIKKARTENKYTSELEPDIQSAENYLELFKEGLAIDDDYENLSLFAKEAVRKALEPSAHERIVYVGDGESAVAGPHGLAMAGLNGIAAAGVGGSIIIESRKGMFGRKKWVGLIGMDGIEPNVKYRVKRKGYFLPV